ncbi:MAG: cobalamin-dependent protein [Acidimicrobiia bacterium]|nr:cobalamin-dependent protein [Acidimicrobiia bacterium]
MSASAAGPRVLVGKAGLDKHDRGARIVARALRDAGYEVVYLPAGHTPEEIAAIAVQEDVAAIGLSLLSGAHVEVFRDLRAALAAEDRADVVLFAGGTIPPADLAPLGELGVVAVLGPGSPTRAVVEAFDRRLRPGGAMSDR